MLVPVAAVHRAAVAINSNSSDISHTRFEDEYHCRIGLSPDVVNYYYLHFDTERDASMFILKWI